MKSLFGMVTLLACAACSELGGARETWDREEPSRYSYDVQARGFLGPFIGVVTVENGVVVSSTIDGRDDVLIGDGTMESLFDDVEFRLDNGNCSSTAEFDETLGYPLDVYSECGIEGDGWRVIRFEVLPEM